MCCSLASRDVALLDKRYGFKSQLSHPEKNDNVLRRLLGKVVSEMWSSLYTSALHRFCKKNYCE